MSRDVVLDDPLADLGEDECDRLVGKERHLVRELDRRFRRR
ncbi:hypothetical protein [Lentzea albida]|nr:hypothetical protein [Lentzea albida]